MKTSEKTFDEFEELVLELDVARILFAEEEEEEEEARIVVSIKNITERRRAENEIQALARFPSENPGPILRIARDGTLLYVNAAGLSQLPDWHLQAGQNAPSMMRDVVSEALNRGKARLLDLEHCERVYSFFVAPIADAGYANLYGQDITDRKQAEEALRRSEENFRRSLNDSPLGVRIVTVEGETIYANRAILDIYGCDSIEELTAIPVEKRYTPKSFAEHQIRKEKRKRGDYDPSEYDISIIRKNGDVRQLQVFRKDVLWNGERQFQVVYQDITERKRSEEELRASREQLRALAGRLQAVREEERTNIAREIHDELGGALTGLKIDFSLLTRAALKIENETVRISLLDEMDSMIKSIDTTIHTVRRIAMELRPGVLDDLGLVAALEWQLIDFEKRTGIRCEFFPPMEEISLGDDLSTALFRIFQEALTNVARHSGATEVRVRLCMYANSSTLEVEDNGKGIEKEKTLSSKSLGLLGMRERAEIFGGHITVTGAPGIGTTVMVEIPPSSTPLLAAGEFISLADFE